jgi:hypothetical protein
MIAALSGSINLDDGIILGDVASGLAESGVTHSFTRRLREKGTVTGGFTKLSSDFLEEQVSLEFAFSMSGNKQTTGATPAGSEFKHQKGIKALLGACGLTGAISVSTPTVGWEYKPADVSIATARVFDSGVAWVIRDIRGNWDLSQSPGEIGIMTCSLTGVVDSFNASITFPTFDYEEQVTVNSPSVESVSPLWGGISRGWTELGISCDNEIEIVPDSASSTGNTPEQIGRTITIEMTIRDDSSDIDYTRAQLALTSAPTDDLTYTAGSAATGSDSAVAYQVECLNIEVRSYAPDLAGRKSASKITGICTGLTDGSEFTLVFL